MKGEGGRGVERDWERGERGWRVGEIGSERRVREGRRVGR